MENKRPYWKVIVSLTFSLLATIAIVVAGVWLIKIFMPFVIGWLISCIANPVVCWLDKKLKIEKKLGSAIIIVIVLGAVIGLLYLVLSLLVKELGGWVMSLPDLFKSISAEMEQIGDKLSGILEMLPNGLKNSLNTFASGIGETIGDLVAKLSEPTITIAGDVAKQIPSLVIGGFVMVLSAYFFVADRDAVIVWAKKVTPNAIYKRLAMAVSHFKVAVGGYFIAQFKIMGVDRKSVV